jgi:hypothetical protein
MLGQPLATFLKRVTLLYGYRGYCFWIILIFRVRKLT